MHVAPHELYCVRPGVLAASVDPVDGHVRWSRADTDRGSPARRHRPVLSGGLVQIVSGDGKRLAALDPATGATRWSHDVARYDGGIARVGGVVLLPAPTAKSPLWTPRPARRSGATRSPGSRIRTSSRTRGEVRLAVASAGNGTRVTAVDPQTGATRWQRRLNGTLGLVGAHDGVVWFTSTAIDQYTDAVVRYDVADRSVRRIALPLSLPSSQAVVQGGTVYLLAGGGSLVAVGTKSSAQLWRVETSVSTASAPVVSGRRLYLTAADGRLLAVGTPHGAAARADRARLGDGRGWLVSAIPARSWPTEGSTRRLPTERSSRSTGAILPTGESRGSRLIGEPQRAARPVVRRGAVPEGTAPGGQRRRQPSLLTSRTAPVSAEVAIAAYARRPPRPALAVLGGVDRRPSGRSRRAAELRVVDQQLDRAVRDVDRDDVAVLDQRDGAAGRRLRRDVADRQARGAAGEAAVGDQRARLAEAAALEVARSGRASPACRGRPWGPRSGSRRRRRRRSALPRIASTASSWDSQTTGRAAEGAGSTRRRRPSSPRSRRSARLPCRTARPPSAE